MVSWRQAHVSQFKVATWKKYKFHQRKSLKMHLRVTGICWDAVFKCKLRAGQQYSQSDHATNSVKNAPTT